MNENSKGLFRDMKESFFGSKLNSAKNFAITIAIMGVMIALSITFERLFSIQATPALRFSFTFIVYAITGMLLGGLKGALLGALADVVGFFLFPPIGGFNIFITLCTVMTGFVYGMLLYNIKFKSKANRINAIIRIVIAALLNELVCELIFKTKALSYAMGKAFYAMFATRIVKAGIMVPLEIVVLIVLYFVLFPTIKKMVNNALLN